MYCVLVVCIVFWFSVLCFGLVYCVLIVCIVFLWCVLCFGSVYCVLHLWATVQLYASSAISVKNSKNNTFSQITPKNVLAQWRKV